ncbi:glycosyltransferase family 2 protein [Candidatus Daviesbacteria bacterium]|nr:glycosyltransferase family 2 protein [Candidatus Daviesbacteria bacterium]MBI2334534.1 glycosyltransferase family 2 protein [Candidatus Daviesbacteria bacterium]
MRKTKKIIAIFIAYNAAGTLEKFYHNFPKELVDEIILVDDASKDQTYRLAKKLGIRSYRNSINLGYGGNMKKALNLALDSGADIIVDIHPDGEYKPTAIPDALEKIEDGFEFVLGNRFISRTHPLKSGMYFWKWIPIRFLNLIDKIVLGVNLDDFHQGFRVYTKKMLKKLNYSVNSNNYLFSFELIAEAVYRKIKISQVPVEVSYTGKKRGASLKNSIKYSLGTFKVLALFILARLGFKTNLFL